VLTVNPVPSITGPANVCVGSSVTLSSAIAGGTWISSSGFATVGSTTGIVTGMVAGGVNITYTLPTGCKSVMPVPISANYSITGAATACTGASITLANAVAGGSWSSSDSTMASAGASGIVSGVSVGTTTISYTNPAGCVKSVVVTVNPGAGAISGSPFVCQGATAPLSVAVAGGTWASSNAAIVGVGSTGIVSGLSPGFMVTISYTLSNGCRATKVISVNPNPAAITGSLTVCQGLATTLASATAGGTWSTSDSSIITNSGAVVTAANAGTAIVSYTLSTGCQQTKVVTVNPLAAITGAGSVCAGSTIALANVNAGGTWTSSSAAVATIGTAGIVNGVAAGTSNISYTIPGGCRSTAVVSVMATPSLSGSLVMCPASTVSLTASLAGGTWASSNTAVATLVGGAVTGISAGYSNITYTMPSGCFAVKTVTVNPMPSAISGGNTVCAGSAIALSNSITGGTWSSSNGAVATVGTSGVATGVAGGIATITYSTGVGCTVTQSITVGPILPIGGTTSACLGMTTTLSDGSTGGTWTSSNPAIAAINATNGIVSGVSIGTAVVTYALPSGCARTTIVSVNAVPSSITGAGVVCASVTLTLAGDVAGGIWTSSNASIAAVGSVNGVVAGVASGTAVVTYTGGLACKVVAVITVNSSPAITGTTKACAGSTTTLANTLTGGAWSSSNTSVAGIGSDNGIVAGVCRWYGCYYLRSCYWLPQDDCRNNQFAAKRYLRFAFGLRGPNGFHSKRNTRRGFVDDQ
jgi:uncharacterized protein YjdB